jgi:hypothetical protein
MQAYRFDPIDVGGGKDYATLGLLFGAFLSPETESGYHTRIPLEKTSFCLNLSAGPLK